MSDMKYCMNCGAAVPSSARFCAACGTTIDTDLTRAASRGQQRQSTPALQTRQQDSGEVERVIFTARPTMLFIMLGYGMAALAGILLIVLLVLLAGSAIPIYVSILLALALLLIPAYYHIRRNTVRYTLTDSKIEIDRGLIARTTRNIPLRNIQDVTVSATIMQRMLGFGNLVVDNASEEGGLTMLRNIPDPRRHADMVLRELRRWH